MVSVKAYYNETVETVRRDLNGEQDFLTNEEVKRRQEKFGFNELAEGKKKSGLQIFLEQYKDFLVLILIVSAVVSLFLGETESAAVILLVITMNAILGTVQTIKAENSLESLKTDESALTGESSGWIRSVTRWKGNWPWGIRKTWYFPEVT